MASEADMSESTIRNLSMFLPLILGIATSQGPDRETGDQIRERAVLINPVTHSMIVIEGSGNLDELFRELSSKEGPSPASKASIDAMPTVEISEGGECVICLEEYKVGEKAKEMPCEHKFHSGCIEKWLGIHGSCPVCRFRMPVEEEEEKKSGGGEEGEGRGRGGEREIRVSIWVGSGGRRGSDRAGESGDSNSDSEGDENVEVDGSSAQDMDWNSSENN
ncbi:hypothetical protein L1049_002275 [Liquidambar formosana]|uniref:RING-type E3 ubiquitin transferase n=1 Tax=Liquidambar formosana TaxID=63359 RepID=A0AAP0NHG0_LIQFO